MSRSKNTAVNDSVPPLPGFRERPRLRVLAAEAPYPRPEFLKKLVVGVALATLPKLRARLLRGDKGGAVRGELLLAVGWAGTSGKRRLLVATWGAAKTCGEFALIAIDSGMHSTMPVSLGFATLKPRSRPPAPALFLDSTGRIAINAGSPFGGSSLLLDALGFKTTEFTPRDFRRFILNELAEQGAARRIRARGGLGSG
jgi:hypothetical protein